VDEASWWPQTIPGIGPIIASAIETTITDPTSF
jgi:hypothetical protein